MKEQKVLIVGAGIGGLATALRLATKGFNVEILEKNNQPGGRLNQIKKDGFTFDTGPSFFSMSYEFEDFARDCGITLPFTYHQLDPLYTVHFQESQQKYHLFLDVKKLAQQFKNIEPDFEQKFTRYLIRTQKLYESSINTVVKRNFNSLLDYFKALTKVDFSFLPLIYRNFWDEVSKYFSSSEVREIISLVAFFLGRTPFDTMAIYTLLSYTEFKHDGYYNVSGGMYKIVEGLTKELLKNNVKISYNTEIIDYEATENNKLTFLIDNNGNKHSADIYVINSDAAYFRGKVFKRKKYSLEKLEKMKWTMGYLTMYIGLDCKLNEIEHHNYYLGKNYKNYSYNITSDFSKVDKPYYYVNVLSKHNKECAPENCESLFFVCPVPNLLIKNDWSDAEKIVDSIIEDFEKRIGKSIKERIVSKTVYTPVDWQNRFNLFKGSGLGLAHTFDQIGALRPKNFDEVFRNVFYVGASTVPGAGIPMAIISSKLATKRIMEYVNKS